MHLLAIFLAGYASIFLLGFQSRAVNHGNYKMAMCGSFCIAIMQTTLWGALFKDLSWSASIVYGLSGMTGIASSMYVHQRWFTKKDRGSPDR
jgi:uncharacterized membrane protein YuzA (DUF378 family)